MIQLSPAYTQSIREAVNHDLWTPEEQQGMIERQDARELKDVVRRYRCAGKHLELTGGSDGR
jgi:hypothetical protein